MQDNGFHSASMNLRTIREARGLSQRDLAELVGVDQATIQRAETMHSTARLATIAACAKALGVTLADIFADDRSGLEAALVKAFRRVPVEKRAGLHRPPWLRHPGLQLT